MTSIKRSIPIFVNRTTRALADFIRLRTMFTFEGPNDFSENALKLEVAFEGFLAAHNIKPVNVAYMLMDHNGFWYRFPSYEIDVNRQQYLLLDQFMLYHPELSAIVISWEFSDSIKREIEKTMFVQARQNAADMAESNGLILSNEYEIVDLSADKAQSRVFPARSVRTNYLMQDLVIDRKYVFYIEDKSEMSA